MALLDGIVFKRWKRSTLNHFEDKPLVGYPAILWVHHNADEVYKEGGLSLVKQEFDNYLCSIQKALVDDSIPKDDEEWFDNISEV